MYKIFGLLMIRAPDYSNMVIEKIRFEINLQVMM